MVQSKKEKTPEEAIALLEDSDTILVGGFGLCGTPFTLIDCVGRQTKAMNLTVISNNLGEAGKGLGKLLQSGHLKKAIGSYFTSNRDAVKAWKNSELEIELIPQGTLAEAIRAGGAGIAGFYIKTGVGTQLAAGKEEKVFNGERHILIEAIRGRVALINAWKADELGNLIYSKSARNFNPMMATAADLVIAEVDEIVPVGELDPERIVTPHNYVDVLVKSRYVKKEGVYVEKAE
ncbi:3-oxoacid CoA-transferase subunit A [Bacillus oleivorans]|uniref:3-oxoacid CoA-transferase subunit A n=1 Tax=Bacillus oleivorans TaxID=1448271 RepID=A0A285CMT4_9BACI|nr:CoA transferase subunit A [Bacillus oleivorans]SNX68821.1 3-oxoacid CoA-transferase subunit A [Bacillus oleivorans]